MHQQYKCQNSNLRFNLALNCHKNSSCLGSLQLVFYHGNFLPADISVRVLIVIAKSAFKLKTRRIYLLVFVCFCKQHLNNNWNYRMKILAYSLLTVDWACDYCGDSGRNNNSFTCFVCWSVLPRGPRECIGSCAGS